MRFKSGFVQRIAIVVCLLGIAGCCVTLAGQATTAVGRWAKPDEPTAKMLIDWERKWAESACDHNGIEKTIMAEDFYAVAPDGSQYGKKEAIANAASSKPSERDCKMYEVKVHFFHDNVAVLYGSESAIYPAGEMPDKKEHTVKLTWVDTWLKRDGQWKIIAAEDMPSEGK
jgi:hypothetical protein